MAKGPNDFPSSPDELAGGVRGRVGGVTRIGPRAFGIAFFVVCGLLVAILYGVNKQSDKPKNEALSSPPPAIQTDEAHFGSNEPIVATAAPATPPPPLVLPTNAVPDLDKQSATSAPAAVAPAAVQNSGPSAEDQEAAAQRAKDEQARADEEKRRRELLAAALKSPILTGQSASGGSNGAGPGSGVQLAFAGNGDAGSANAGGSIAGSGSAQGGGTGLVSRSTAENTKPQPSATEFLEGPTGQYKINAANIALPNGASATDFLQADRFSPLSPFEITASSVIPAELITSLDSELPGLISAQIREDVYDTKTGRYLLIPRGSRLVGLYKSDLAYGQSRVLVAWQRLIFPDTTSIDLLNMGGADVEGGAGLGGQVDNHYGKIFGAALLTSILAAGLQLSQPQQATTSIFQTVSPGQAVSQAVGQQLSTTATQIINKDLNIPPTLHVAKGYPFLVFVDRDIVLPGPYRAQ